MEREQIDPDALIAWRYLGFGVFTCDWCATTRVGELFTPSPHKHPWLRNE